MQFFEKQLKAASQKRHHCLALRIKDNSLLLHAAAAEVEEEGGGGKEEEEEEDIDKEMLWWNGEGRQEISCSGNVEIDHENKPVTNISQWAKRWL